MKVPNGLTVMFAAIFLFLPIIMSLSCAVDRHGSAEFIDDSYEATVFATSSDGFDAPDGILWKNGRFYLADEGGPAFRIWTDAKNVRTLSTSADGIQSPEDFVVDAEGNIFFTDDDAGGVWKINGNGKTSLLAGKKAGLESTEGIALSPDGDLLVGDGKVHKVFLVRRSGEVEEFLGADAGITKPESMVSDAEGNLYIADNTDNILYLVSPDKILTRIIEKREGFSPETLWFADRTLWITDSDNGCLFRYDPDSGLSKIAEFKGAWKKVSGITTDESGNVFLTIQTHIDKKISFLLKLSRKDQGT